MKISNQTQAIKHFIQKMDIEMVDTFLDEKKTYQDFEKCLFIKKLQGAFEAFGALGDTFLFAHEGNCNSCDKTKCGITFIGNNSNNYMNIIFDEVDNKIYDLYECADFRNKQLNLNLKERIYIDNDPGLPF
ncbi:MAG: hypothetical protein L6Q66_05810 [Bacteroidia bacterium]|nr:hypothetical protein [Bacteroidia bacterium]